MGEHDSNVKPVEPGFVKIIMQSFEAIWPNFFIKKYAVTIQCGRCSRPYTYWVRYKPGGNLRKFCDDCVRDK